MRVLHFTRCSGISTLDTRLLITLRETRALRASFGGLLRDFRQQSDWTQVDLADALGWAPSKVSDLEQGNLRPSEEVVDKLSRVFGLDRASRSELMFAAGCRPDDDEIAHAMGLIQPSLDRWLVPAYVLDFSWRFLAWNAPAAKMLGFNEERARRERPNILEFFFDPSWKVRERLDDWQYVAKQKLAAFYLDRQRLGFNSQKWYGNLMVRLSAFEDFGEFWTETVEFGERALLRLNEVEDFRRVTIRMKTPEQGTLDFGMLLKKVDFDVRLVVAFYAPLGLFGDQADMTLVPDALKALAPTAT
jgi:transcriptional regulator with XRE-family HTH domain